MDPTKLKRKISLVGYTVDQASDCQLMVVLREAEPADGVLVFTAEDEREVRVLVAGKSDPSLFAVGEVVSDDFVPDARLTPEESSVSAWLKQSLGSRKVIDEATGKTVRRLHPERAAAVLRRHRAQ